MDGAAVVPPRSNDDVPLQSDDDVPLQSDDDVPLQSDDDVPLQSNDDVPLQSNDDVPLQSNDFVPPRSNDGVISWWTSLKKFPTEIIDQHFGYELFNHDLLEPFKESYLLPRNQECVDNSGYSSVTFEEEIFKIQFKSGQFTAKEIKVEHGLNFVTISGEHLFRKEGEGESYRKFERRYMLPMDAVADRIRCETEANLVTVWVPRYVHEDVPRVDDSDIQTSEDAGDIQIGEDAGDIEIGEEASGPILP